MIDSPMGRHEQHYECATGVCQLDRKKKSRGQGRRCAQQRVADTIRAQASGGNSSNSI